MSYGLRVYSSSGALMLDTNHRLGRIIGRINTGVSNGSYTYTGSYSGALFAALLDARPGAPAITTSGATVTWTFGSLITNRDSVIIIGIF